MNREIKSMMIFLFLVVWIFARFRTLDKLLIFMNTELTPKQQESSKITTQPGWDSAYVDWFIIYPDKT